MKFRRSKKEALTDEPIEIDGEGGAIEETISPEPIESSKKRFVSFRRGKKEDLTNEPVEIDGEGGTIEETITPEKNSKKKFLSFRQTKQDGAAEEIGEDHIPVDTNNAPTPEKKKKRSKVMDKIKRKTSNLFKPDPTKGITEKVKVGDEIAIISVSPKASYDKENTQKYDDNDLTNYHALLYAPEEEKLKKQKFSFMRRSKSTVPKGLQDNTNNTQQIPRSYSTPIHHEQQELKKQKFSLVRPFSSMKRNNKEQLEPVQE
ncbi:predicted protein [Chaetoceros tenuissimus]|uniref:Uncharacterized protein n=1 Tax=Chaetoceros tenuissimus TaxID=426638 RepID=A0AAD3CQQ7_9STRA|nr:predicted protein [Chaetoceros tenuissimus]